jgi:hypothetical protein
MVRALRKVAEGHAETTLRGKQIPLFQVAANGNGNGQAAFRDPAFGDNKSLPIHRWVPWIAGYSAAFVDDVITTRLPYRKAALVLDPFCGVARRCCRPLYAGIPRGFEINPYPARRAQTQCPPSACPNRYDPDRMQSFGPVENCRPSRYHASPAQIAHPFF